jgi:hypothetical protein
MQKISVQWGYYPLSIDSGPIATVFHDPQNDSYLEAIRDFTDLNISTQDLKERLGGLAICT